MPVRFSDDDGFDFAVRCLLNGVPYGMADPGEVLAATGAVAPGDHDGWFEALTALGARVEATAETSAAGGHDLSASVAYLRAANYRYAGFWYVLGTRDPGRWSSAWLDHRRCLDAALAHRSDIEVFDVEWPGTTLPVIHARPHGTNGPAPLVVVQNGLGAPLSDALMTGVLDFAARGYHAVAFDGPGQGRPRALDGVGPVDDWARVVATMLDAVVAREADTVDRARIAIVGIGDGAALATRAAADPRIAALICDPGVLRPVDGAFGQLPDALRAAWADPARDDASFDRMVRDACAADAGTAFGVAKITEQWPDHTLGDVLERLERWDLAPALDDLRGPVLITDPDAAAGFPGQSAELATALGGRATLAVFTSAEGAGLDCEIGAPLVRAQRIGDWLDTVFGARSD